MKDLTMLTTAKINGYEIQLKQAILGMNELVARHFSVHSAG